MKILYVTTISDTMDFFPEHIKMLMGMGHSVELACNCENPISSVFDEMGVIAHHIPFSRSPFAKSNFMAMKTIKELVKKGNYDIVHTHTPNASACVRFACRKLRKRGLKIFYTAHGFHFFKGAPLKNWMLYYPVERICSRWTDTMITINQEDYTFASKKMQANNVVYVPGVGIDLNKFDGTIINRQEKRNELGIPENAILLISIGELNDNKNHETVIKAIKDMDVYYVIAGEGAKKEHLQNLIDEQGMTDRIKLLGFRTDVKDLYAASDVFVFPSFREGLSVSVMEAMASGLPCAASRIRGNIDLVDENGGRLFDPYNIEECSEAIIVAMSNMSSFGAYNKKKIKCFSSESVTNYMKDIYNG